MNMKRMRGRNNRSGGGQGGGGGGGIRHHSTGGGIPMNRNHVFDSSGPDLRIRGTAQQLFEKYLQLGRDASGSGDRVMAESYFQHAEHYFRILNAMAQVQQQGPQGGGQQQPGQQPSGQQNGYQNGHQRRLTNDGTMSEGEESGEEDRDQAGDQPLVEIRPTPVQAPPEE